MIERPMPRQSVLVGSRSRRKWRPISVYAAKQTPLITNSHAKKKCQRRPMDNQCGPGIVIHDGKPREVGWPFSVDTPNTPVVVNVCEPITVTPRKPCGVCCA